MEIRSFKINEREIMLQRANNVSSQKKKKGIPAEEKHAAQNSTQPSDPYVNSKRELQMKLHQGHNMARVAVTENLCPN